MKTKVGLWIDHRKAVIVTLSDKGEELVLSISGVEKQLRRTGDSPMKGRYEAQKVPADDVRNRAFENHLNSYYDAVIGSISKADSILILGPGLAKSELKKRLAKNKLDKKIVGVKTADKMTNQQVAALIRKHFAK